MQRQSAYLIAQTHCAHNAMGPGRIKCLRAPSHQILAKSDPQKARYRDKAEFTTKVRKSSISNSLF